MIAPEFTCDVSFQGPEDNIQKLLDDIQNSIEVGDSIININNDPNLEFLLKRAGIDFVSYYSTEKDNLWNKYKSMGHSYDDSSVVFNEDLKTNFNANFEDIMCCYNIGQGKANLDVNMSFCKNVDPNVLFLISQAYGLDSYQYAGFEGVRGKGSKGSFNNEVPDLAYAVIEAIKPNGDTCFSGMYTEEEYKALRTRFDYFKFNYTQIPLQENTDHPLILGMYYDDFEEE